MGKRLHAGYELSVIPSVLGPNRKEKTMLNERADQLDLQHSFFGLSAKNTVYIDYVTSRRASVGGSASYYQTKVVFRRPVIDTMNFSGYNYSNSKKIVDSLGNLSKGTIKCLSFNFYIKRFNKKLIAPFGAYRKYELFMLTYKTIYRVKDFNRRYDPSAPWKGTYVGDGENTNLNLGIAFSVGKQRIFYDRLVLNYSLRAAYVFGTILSSGDSSQPVTNRSPVNETRYIKTSSTLRLAAREMINVTIGLGYLAK